MITEIRNGTVIAWIDDSHQIVKQGKVVFDDQTIIYVGQTYEGKSDQVIDATGRLVIPGLINNHLHVTDTPFTKGYLEDIGDKTVKGAATNHVALYKVLPNVRHATCLLYTSDAADE